MVLGHEHELMGRMCSEAGFRGWHGQSPQDAASRLSVPLPGTRNGLPPLKS